MGADVDHGKMSPSLALVRNDHVPLLFLMALTMLKSSPTRPKCVDTRLVVKSSAWRIRPVPTTWPSESTCVDVRGRVSAGERRRASADARSQNNVGGKSLKVVSACARVEQRACCSVRAAQNTNGVVGPCLYESAWMAAKVTSDILGHDLQPACSVLSP